MTCFDVNIFEEVYQWDKKEQNKADECEKEKLESAITASFSSVSPEEHTSKEEEQMIVLLISFLEASHKALVS